MPEALEAVFPATTLQTHIVHLIRSSLTYANWKTATLSSENEIFQTFPRYVFLKPCNKQSFSVLSVSGGAIFYSAHIPTSNFLAYMYNPSACPLSGDARLYSGCV